MIILNDLSQCMPESARSTSPGKNHWRLLEYEAEGISGTMLSAGELSNAPEVTLPLGVKGWHRIHIGFWYPNIHEAKTTIIRLRLTDEQVFTRIWHKGQEKCWLGTQIYETPFKAADLSGQDLVIAQQNKGLPAMAHVAYVKLEPLSGEQVEQIRRAHDQAEARKVVALNDGTSFLARDGCTTREEILEQIELYRHSDVGRVSWAVNYGQLTNYPSKFGLFCCVPGAEVDSITGENEFSSFHALALDGIIPFVEALNHVREMNLKFDAMFRLGILTGDHIVGQYRNCFSAEHPEFRIVDRDGAALPKLSYAFEQVRGLMLDIIGEIAGQYDIDGVDLSFIRGPMYVGYEKPVIEEFKEKYGEDPRQISETDKRWLAHKAEYVTQFLRDAKRLVDEIGADRGRAMSLSAMVYSEEESNIYHGLDVRTWLKEDLLDSVQATPLDKNMVKLVTESNCRFIAGVGLRKPDNYVRNGLLGHEYGADGFSVWDTNCVQDRPEHWEVIKNMGHKERLEEFGRQLPKMKTVAVKSVDGVDLCHTTNKDTPHNWPPEMLTIITCG